VPVKILIRYGEIALKGKNRRFFEDFLLQNLKQTVRGSAAQIVRLRGRFLAIAPEKERDKIISRLSRVFGVVSLSAVQPAALELPAIQAAAAALVQDLAPEAPLTFKVEARRSNKSFPLTSPEINRLVGAYILEMIPHLRVDVHNPALRLSIEIGQEEAFLYHDRHSGPGGLPVGVTGKGLLLLSGGIDSPVAGWMAMKRGLAVEAVHFHSFPFTGRRSQEKAADLCRALALYAGEIPLHMVSVTAIQKEIRSRCPEELGILLLRRMMLRAAEKIARRRGLEALITGESLGQVASQTLESMAVIGGASGMLILRPLLGLDKHEIVDRARAVGTYAISIRPFEDCCTLFVPKHPATRPSPKRVEEAEAALDIGGLLEEALAGAELEFIKE
jgi:thiamine biosynthesis protein ThiI